MWPAFYAAKAWTLWRCTSGPAQARCLHCLCRHQSQLRMKPLYEAAPSLAKTVPTAAAANPALRLDLAESRKPLASFPVSAHQSRAWTC